MLVKPYFIEKSKKDGLSIFVRDFESVNEGVKTLSQASNSFAQSLAHAEIVFDDEKSNDFDFVCLATGLAKNVAWNSDYKMHDMNGHTEIACTSGELYYRMSGGIRLCFCYDCYEHYTKLYFTIYVSFVEREGSTLAESLLQHGFARQ